MIYLRNAVRNSMIIQNATDAARAAAISMTGRMIIHAALEISLIVSMIDDFSEFLHTNHKPTRG